MAYIFNNEIKFADSPNLDAFGRLRISEPYTIFNSANITNSGQTEYELILSGSATATYNQPKAEIQFNVTTTGDRVLREQHAYNYYQPGKSHLVIMTGVFGTGVTDVIKRIGYYNDNDGLFFQLSGTTFGINLRTSTSGSIVDTFIPQSDWNIDTLDTGTTRNPSGKHLDVSKTNIYIINFQWLGVGRVIYGLDIDGVIQPIHEILNANNKTEVYMSTGSLPCRYEVISNGGTDSTFKQICSTVMSEGGQEDFGYNETVSNGLTTKTFSTRQSVMSIRLANTFNGVTNRTKAIPISIDLITTTNTVNAYWELVYQRGYLNESNLGGGPTWVGLSDTPIEYSVDGTTITGGTVIDSGYISTSTQTGDKITSSIIQDRRNISLDYSGNTSDYLHLVVTPNVSSDWASKITLKTLY